MAKKDEGTTKVDMVRDALKKLGWDAGPDAYHQYILDTYKQEMSKQHISQTVSNERKRQGVRGRRRRKRGAGRKEAVGAAAGSARVSDILSFVETVKQWEQKIGADGIRDVVKNVLRK